MRPQQLLIGILVPLTLTACADPPDTRPGKPVAHRQEAFKKIRFAFEPMGRQLHKQEYDADQFLLLAKQLVGAKDGPWQYFGPDTNYPPSHATADVWSKPAEFESRRQTFAKAVDDLAAAAESRNDQRVRAAYEAVRDSCQKCHDVFRED